MMRPQTREQLARAVLWTFSNSRTAREPAPRICRLAGDHNSGRAWRRFVKVDLSEKPTDPAAAIGYDGLYALWKSNHDAYGRGVTIGAQQFAQWAHAVRSRLTESERTFFDAPFPAQAK